PNPDRWPPDGRQYNVQCRPRVDRPLGDLYRQRVRQPVRAGPVAVNLGDILPPRRQEGERDVERPALLIGDGPDEPARTVSLPPCHDHVIADLPRQYTCRVPVDRHVADELEGGLML